MKTIRELSEYFGIPYYVVYYSMRGIKACRKHNQKFHIEKARERILVRLESQKERAMEKIAYCDGLIRIVQSAGGKDDEADL